MILEGKKIYLRPFEADDAKHLQEIREDFEGVKSFAGSPFPSNLESQKEWISKMYPKGELKSVYFAIIEKGSNSFCGYCVANDIDYINRKAVVGTFMFISSRGKGFFKDVTHIFHDYLFSQLNLHKLYTFILVSNDISVEAHKQIGFEIEGLIKEHIYQDGVYKDVYFVSLYKSNFYEHNRADKQ